MYLNDEKDKMEMHKNKKDKLPYAVFIAPNRKDSLQDYKEIFTEIISDRIKQKYK